MLRPSRPGALLLSVLSLAACGKLGSKPPPSGPPGYLMSLFSVPAADQAQDDIVTYGIKLGTTGAAAALRAAPTRAAPYQESPAMQARMAWDKARRDAIDSLVEASSRRRHLRSGRRLAATCASDCGAQ